MNPDPFEEPRLKIKRSQQHFIELQDEVKRYYAESPWRINIEIDSLGNETHRFLVEKPIPKKLGVIIGDTIHNLRSSLDILANELVRVNGCSPNYKTSFPIGTNQKNFHEEIEKCLEGCAERHKELIRDLHAYQGGAGHRLWQLHKLDIEDKHKILIPVIAICTRIHLDLPVPKLPNRDPSSLNETVPIALTPATRSPLKSGDIVFCVNAAARDGVADIKASKFDFELGLGPNSILQYASLHTHLSELGDASLQAMQQIEKGFG